MQGSDFLIPAIMAAAFGQGFFGSLHCVGMCGPFVHIVNSRNANRYLINLVYNLGRTVSYATGGFILGYVGLGLNGYVFQELAATLGGLFVIFFALGYIFPGKLSAILKTRIPAPLLNRFNNLVKEDRNPYALAMAFGMISGLLPCGLLYPVYALSLTTGDPASAALTMVIFSLGTYPALLATGLFSNFIYKRLSQYRYKFALGVFMLILGIFTITYRTATYDPENPECETDTEVLPSTTSQ